MFCFERADTFSRSLSPLPGGLAYFSSNLRSVLQCSLEFALQTPIATRPQQTPSP